MAKPLTDEDLKRYDSLMHVRNRASWPYTENGFEQYILEVLQPLADIVPELVEEVRRLQKEDVRLNKELILALETIDDNDANDGRR